MRLLLAVLGAVCILGLMQHAQGQTESASPFIGTWVGTQSWAIENAAPNAQENTPVELTIAMTDGKLTGKMTPFLGGTEGASFIKADIAGGKLIASGVVGADTIARVPTITAPNRRAPNWKDNVQIIFEFSTDRTELKGTADLRLGEVQWLKFKYNLSKKRSRYP